MTTAAESAKAIATAAWTVFVERMRNTHDNLGFQSWTFPQALFISNSVAYFEVARLAHEPQGVQRFVRDLDRVLDDGSGLVWRAAHAQDCPDWDDHRALARLAVDRLTDLLWARAAREILTLHDNLRETEAHAALIALRDALDLAEIDGARCCMMDGIEAFIADDLGKPAAIGAEAWVRDGKAQDHIDWLGDRSGPLVLPEQAGQVMNLVAWVLHEVAQSWGGPLDALRKLDSAVGRTCDRLLFAPACREFLIPPRLPGNRSEIGGIRPPVPSNFES